MESSPFVVHGPLPPEAVHGRDALIADLIGRITQRRPSALVGPRRYGKTSVLRRVAADLGEVTTIYVDLWGSTSAADIARAFDDAIDRADHPFRRTAEATAMTLGLTLGGIGLSMARPPSERPDYNGLLPSLLRVITDTAQQVPTLLVIDEFSAAQRVSDTLAKMRTGLQHHYATLGLLFAGSEPSTMQMLFADRQQPFYAQADIVRIGPLTGTAAVAIINDGFTVTGRRPGPLASLAWDLTRGHPHRLMQVADAVWRATPPEGTVEAHDWAEGLTRLRHEIADGLQRFFDTQPMGHQRVLRLLAHGLPPHASKGALIDLTPGAATRSRDSLIDAGDIDTGERGQLRLTDPMLADWIRAALPI